MDDFPEACDGPTLSSIKTGGLPRPGADSVVTSLRASSVKTEVLPTTDDDGGDSSLAPI